MDGFCGSLIESHFAWIELWGSVTVVALRLLL